MKRLSKMFGAILFSAVLILSFTACGTSNETKVSRKAGDESSKQQETVTEKPVQDDAEEDNQKPSETGTDEKVSDDRATGSDTLVVYFSRTGEQYEVGVIDKGNTAIVADMIVEKTGADAFEILPEDDHYPYTYDELTDVAKQEQNENARPAYAGEVPDLSGYKTIFIGAPVWWGDWPMIMYTFFENNTDTLAGKTLIPFSTHAGSGLSGFDSKLSFACPDSTVEEGLAIAGTDAQNDQDSVRSTVNDWLSEQGY